MRLRPIPLLLMASAAAVAALHYEDPTARRLLWVFVASTVITTLRRRRNPLVAAAAGATAISLALLPVPVWVPAAVLAVAALGSRYGQLPVSTDSAPPYVPWVYIATGGFYLVLLDPFRDSRTLGLVALAVGSVVGGWRMAGLQPPATPS